MNESYDEWRKRKDKMIEEYPAERARWEQEQEWADKGCSVEFIDKPNDKQFGEVKCDCGAQKTQTCHSNWCSTKK